MADLKLLDLPAQPLFGNDAADHRASGSAIRLSYFLRVTNIGDRVNPTIVGVAARQPTIWCRDTRQDHLLCIGSLMASATPASHVWGTGVMHPSYGVGGADPARVYAVRGKLSYAEFRRAGQALRDVPLGDPGYLVAGLLGWRRDPCPVWPLGLIPHYVDRDHPFIQRLAQRDDVIVLDVSAPEAEFFARLSSCRAVISSSLHGLIFSEALGIPNLWVELSDKVAGAGFKFRDWFSLAKTPQERPFVPDVVQTTEALCTRCTLHEIEVDQNALLGALPRSAIEASSASECSKSLVGVRVARRKPTPVFVISYNRARFLKTAIASYRRLETPVDIVVHDNGSEDAETLDLLRELELQGVRIYRHRIISAPDELNEVDRTVQDYFSDWAEPVPYVVTDCDIELASTHPGVLTLFNELLNRFPKVECVGPMLSIADIPRTYPLYNHVMNRHVGQFWKNEPEWTTSRIGRVAYQLCPIDTTFALHRAGSSFRRLKPAMRVYHPFEARHLDWYERCPPAPGYALASSAEIAHWGNASYRQARRDEPLEYMEFRLVRSGPDGVLRARTHRIAQSCEDALFHAQ